MLPQVTGNIRISALLQEMRRRSGSLRRLGQHVRVTERTLKTWLSRPEDELRLHQDNIDAVLKAARELGLDPQFFTTDTPLWNLNEGYRANMIAQPTIPPSVTALPQLLVVNRSDGMGKLTLSRVMFAVSVSLGLCLTLNAKSASAAPILRAGCRIKAEGKGLRAGIGVCRPICRVQP